MKAWSNFFPDILPEVIGCPIPTVEHAIKRAAQQFLSQTHSWKIWLDPVATVIGVTQYDLDLPKGAELVKLERATLNGTPLTVTTPESLPADWVSNNSLPDCVFTDGKTYTVLPAPAVSQPLLLEVSLKPSHGATGIEDGLFDLHGEMIALGALARLLQSGNEYGNPARGAVLEDRFKDAINSAGIQRWRSFSSARPRARISTF